MSYQISFTGCIRSILRMDAIKASLSSNEAVGFILGNLNEGTIHTSKIYRASAKSDGRPRGIFRDLIDFPSYVYEFIRCRADILGAKKSGVETTLLSYHSHPSGESWSDGDLGVIPCLATEKFE